MQSCRNRMIFPQHSRGLWGMRAGKSGPTVVLLHGIGTSAVIWRKILAILDTYFQLVALDLRGYGESPALEGDMTLHTVVADVSRFIQSQTEPVHLVGASFGALTALAVAKIHPSLVRSLTLVGATLGRASLPDPELKKWLEMRYRLADDLPTASADRARGLAGKNPDDATLSEIAAAMRRVGRESYRAVASIIASTDAKPWLESVIHPTLVLCGDEDRVVGLPLSVEIARRIPRSEFEVIPGAGHVPHVEQSELFSEILRAFIDRVTQNERAAASQ
jgi:3-oxoadipate enol-lactonase